MKYFKLFEDWDDESINEANLSGSNKSSNFTPDILQTFHRYVQLSDDQDPQKNMYIDFSTEADAELYKIGSGAISGELESAGIKLSKGTDGIIIMIKTTTELVQVPIYNNNGSLAKKSPAYYVPIKYKGNEYLIAMNKLRKPTGKAVEEWKPDLSSSKNVDVTRPFTPGHPQEAQISQMFVDNTNKDWQFKYNDHIYEVMLIGGANYTGRGHPKTDIELQLSCVDDPAHILTNKNKIQQDIKDGQYKVSLKDKSANFVENWIAPKRAVDIFGQRDLQTQLQKIWDSIKNSDQKSLKGFKKRGSKGNAAALFIGVKDSGYFEWDGKKHSSSVDGWKLPPKALMEAYAGAEKFKGKFDDAIANSFYKGNTPKNPKDFLDNLIPVNDRTVAKNLEPLYIQPQLRNNPSAKGAVFANKIKGKWELNQTWLNQAGLGGKIT
jgi:hypothetical protein